MRKQDSDRFQPESMLFDEIKKRIKLQHALMIFFIYNGFLWRFFASFVEKAETEESLFQISIVRPLYVTVTF